MTALKKTDPPAKMTFDEFMQWYETAEGRWELHDGVPVRRHDPAKGHSERAGHVRAKSRIYQALENALAGADFKCEALGDGMTVKIDENVSYEPDALVYCGDRLDGDELVVPAPVIIVEVLSPSTACKDVSDKLDDYFRLPSVEHYLILDPKSARIVHHYRDGENINQKAVNETELRLEPPGVLVDVGGVFE